MSYLRVAPLSTVIKSSVQSSYFGTRKWDSLFTNIGLGDKGTHAHTHIHNQGHTHPYTDWKAIKDPSTRTINFLKFIQLITNNK